MVDNYQLRAHLQDIVEIFENDPTFLNEWPRMFNQVIDTNRSLHNWQTRTTMGLKTYSELFREVLAAWISLKGDSASLNELCKEAKEANFNYIYDKLEVLQTTPPTLGVWWFQIPQPANPFVGRTDELDQLFRVNALRRNHIVIVTGVGGVGKTALVSQFLNHPSIRKRVNCIWLNCRTKVTLRNSLEQFAPTVIKDPASLSNQRILDSVLKSVPTSKISYNLIVVFDELNAKTTETTLLIEELSKTPNTLTIITTFVRRIVTSDTLVDVSGLTVNDCKDWIKKVFPNEDSSLLEDLTETVIFDPLPIKLAMSYITYRKSTIQGLQSGIAEFMKLQEDQDLSTAETFTPLQFRANMKCIKDHRQNAYTMLQVASCMDNSSIPIQFFQDYKNILYQNFAEVIVNAELKVLISLSLVDIDDNGFTVHPLCKGFVLDDSRSDEFGKLLSKIIQNTQLQTSPTQHLRHLAHCWKFAMQLLPMNEDNIATGKSLLAKLTEKRLKEECVMLAEDLVFYLKRSETYGADHKSTLEIQKLLAYSLRDVGNDVGAIRNLEEILSNPPPSMSEKEYIEMENCKYQIAYSKCNLKDYDGSLKILRSIRDTFKYPGTPDGKAFLLKLRHASAVCFDYKEMYDEAMTEYAELISKQSNDEASQLVTHHSRGHCLYSLKKYEDAEKVFRQVLKRRGERGEIQNRGPVQNKVICTKYMLAKTVFAQHLYAEALPILSETYNLQCLRKGEDDEDTKKTKILLWSCMEKVRNTKHSGRHESPEDVLAAGISPDHCMPVLTKAKGESRSADEVARELLEAKLAYLEKKKQILDS